MYVCANIYIENKIKKNSSRGIPFVKNSAEFSRPSSPSPSLYLHTFSRLSRYPGSFILLPPPFFQHCQFLFSSPARAGKGK